jgi:hypothetical protein
MSTYCNGTQETYAHIAEAMHPPAMPAGVECHCYPGDGSSVCENEGMCYEAWLEGRLVHIRAHTRGTR